MLRLVLFFCLLPGLLLAEARLPALPEADQAQWLAVGRLNTAGYNRRSMCSATLIAPDRVLTAAHCVLRGTATRVRLSDLRFVAGWRQGTAQGIAGVTQVVLHPKALHEGAVVPRYDLAVVVLDQPLNLPPLAVSAQARAPLPYGMMGYEASRPHIPGARFDCLPLMDNPASPTLRCPVEHGASGGPVLALGDAGWEVIGVISAMRGDVLLYAPLRDWDGFTVPPG